MPRGAECRRDRSLKAAKSWSNRKKAAFFPAVLLNGVETGSISGGMGFSVSSVDGRRSASPVFDGRTLDVCPTDYGSFPEDAPPLTCGCDAASVKRGGVSGANPYRYSLSLCRAALNAGAIGLKGGKILVKPEKAAFFPVSHTQRRGDRLQQRGHGVQRKLDDGRPAVRQSCIRRTDTRCLPDQLWTLPRGRAAATCGCDAASVKRGDVYGANPVIQVRFVAVPGGATRRRDRCRRWKDRSPARGRQCSSLQFHATAWIQTSVAAAWGSV